jgi:bla regulator protein blaR1
MWVLVLVKFVTPPLFILPITIELPTTVERTDFVEPQIVSRQDDSRSSPLTAVDPKTINREDRANVPREATASPPTVAFLNRTTGRKTSESTLTTRVWQSCSILWVRQPVLPWVLLTIWLTGVVGWTGWQIARTIRFHCRVRSDTTEAGEMQTQTVRLARQMGLSSAPQVRLINATVSPMLWGCGSRAVLLFPADLAERLDDESRATLLAHELAHYNRGDHWVRLLELFVIGLFWWHPVAWWARRQIEEAEEECCDAWVIGEFPHAPRRYAEALLITIDFLCEAPVHLPPVASGLGQSHFLRHRLTKIVRGVSPKSLSVRNRWSLAVVAALLLPLHPFALASSSLRNPAIETVRPIVAENSAVVPSQSIESNDDVLPVVSETPPVPPPPALEASPQLPAGHSELPR